MYTTTEENYLKAIYKLSDEQQNPVSTNSIAGVLETSAASVTDMLKRLTEKGLLHYEKYRGVRLTEQGMQIAVQLVRRHRLWEVFLVEKLDFAWDEVHEVAEQLEHIKSEALIEKLDAHLGFPRVDPHGDPIPSKDGEFKKVIKKLLSEVAMGVEGICVGVKDSSAPFLKFLDRNNIAIRDTIKVVEKEEFDGSLYIEVNGKTVHISNQIATNLYLELKDEE